MLLRGLPCLPHVVYPRIVVMMPFVRKLALIGVLLLLPLQGLTAALSALQCATADAGAVYDSDTSYAAAEEHGSDTVDGFVERAFCGQSFSALPVGLNTTGPADLPVFEPTLSLLVTLFFPEQPHRPPLFSRA